MPIHPLHSPTISSIHANPGHVWSQFLRTAVQDAFRRQTTEVAGHLTEARRDGTCMAVAKVLAS